MTRAMKQDLLRSALNRRDPTIGVMHFGMSGTIGGISCLLKKVCETFGVNQVLKMRFNMLLCKKKNKALVTTLMWKYNDFSVIGVTMGALPSLQL